MMEDIKAKLKQYHRNLPKQCDECGLTSDKLEAQDTCPDCLTDPYSY
jgi:rubrerythrin